jgi:hypothetical protein
VLEIGTELFEDRECVANGVLEVPRVFLFNLEALVEEGIKSFIESLRYLLFPALEPLALFVEMPVN